MHIFQNEWNADDNKRLMKRDLQQPFSTAVEGQAAKSKIHLPSHAE